VYKMHRIIFKNFHKNLSVPSRGIYKKFISSKPAVVIGCSKNEELLQLTENGSKLNDITNGKLTSLLELSNFKGDVGKIRNFYDLHEDYPHIVVTGLGETDIKFNENEDYDENKENVRISIGAAVKSLCSDEVKSVLIDNCNLPAAAAEGALLSARKFDTFKSKKSSEEINVSLLELQNIGESLKAEWKYGMISADSQNFAATLMDTPANYLYPVLFAEAIQERFAQSSDVEVKVRDLEWIKEKQMNCFLSVGKGSINEPRFLELHYKRGGDETPIVLVGKGVTFDTGGISIKPSKGMAAMSGDMGGAACVLATLDAVDKLKLPVNMVVLVPLAENMPSGSAAKPGDVVTAMNGITVENDNTDAEGRLILADALCYSAKFHPKYLIDVATLTGAIAVALGSPCTGVYSTSQTLWEHLHQAGIESGDRMWRMPIYSYYTKQMKCSRAADLKNTQKKSGYAGSPTAAAFLKEFVSTSNWAHLDIAGVMENQGDQSYLPTGMSGRPTRTLIEMIRRIDS